MEKLLTEEDFNNNSDLEFKSLSNELYRVYIYSDGFEIKIDNPLKINVNFKSGGHRVWDAKGFSHYIVPGWKHLYWKAKNGKPNFDF